MTGPAPPGYLSPAVRAMARLHAFQLAGVAGTGSNGRVTLTDVLTSVTPVRETDAPVRDCILETPVDVTGDDRSGPDIAAAVRKAIQTVHAGRRVAVSVGDGGATCTVPPLLGDVGATLGIGAPFWTAAAALTADGQRVLTPRMHRVVVVRFLPSYGDADAGALLSAAAAAIGRIL